MSVGIFVKLFDKWCPVKGIWVERDGVWCPVKKVYTKVNGQWCLCFPSGGGCNYTITQFGWENPEYLWYSAGIDATKNGCFLLHQHSYVDFDTHENWLSVEFFDTDGNFVKEAISFGKDNWPQCVRKIGDEIWFSYTSYGEGTPGFYAIPWDETLQIYPTGADLKVQMPYSWKVVERFDGRIFISGLDGDDWIAPNSIFWYDNDSIMKVVEIGGCSCGFDFDNEGNLWAGEYLLDEGQSYILPCRLGMWRKEAVDGDEILTWADASVVIDLGSHPDTGFNWGVSDVVCDDRGNVYVSMNTYEPGYFDSNHECGAVIKVYKDEEGNYQKEYLLLRDNTGNNNWDWFRSMTIDGNNLILDIDHTQMDSSSPDACQVIQI